MKTPKILNHFYKNVNHTTIILIRVKLLIINLKLNMECTKSAEEKHGDCCVSHPVVPKYRLSPLNTVDDL